MVTERNMWMHGYFTKTSWRIEDNPIACRLTKWRGASPAENFIRSGDGRIGPLMT
jgi:hypothetical protein